MVGTAIGKNVDLGVGTSVGADIGLSMGLNVGSDRVQAILRNKSSA